LLPPLWLLSGQGRALTRRWREAWALPAFDAVAVDGFFFAEIRAKICAAAKERHTK
jgi:hypothetical protein